MNNRVYYAIQQVQIAPIGTPPNGYTDQHVVYGLQSAGINTNFSLSQVYELGQQAIYENIEEVPDIEVTLEKVLDGYAIPYHLATPSASSPTLAGRANQQCQVLMTIYDDDQDSASGTPIVEVEMSGMYVSQVSFTFPVGENCTNSTTLVGNNKVWRLNPSGIGRFPTNDHAPIGTGGVQRREDVIFGSGGSVLPPSIRGITNIGNGTGYNLMTSGKFGAAIQNINISCNLGREALNQLGTRKPFYRYVNFPVEVTTEIEVLTKDGDLVNALEDADNLTNETIIIKLKEGLIVDCGRRNKLSSVSNSGGNAGGGDNVTTTYSYQTFNHFTVKHPMDPAGFYP
ncbi:MAG: hypothetical protein SNJ71_00355 [Bacteroidales bacterium]